MKKFTCFLIALILAFPLYVEAVNVRVQDLPEVTTGNSTDDLIIDTGSITYKITKANLLKDYQSIPGTSLTVGSVYYMASGGLTVANSTTVTAMPAICIANTTTSCQFSGSYKFGSSQGWTRGQVLYTNTASGTLTYYAPSATGNGVQRFGIALANDTVLILPSLDVGTVQ